MFGWSSIFQSKYWLLDVTGIFDLSLMFDFLYFVPPVIISKLDGGKYEVRYRPTPNI